jgi:hypothetical protein
MDHVFLVWHSFGLTCLKQWHWMRRTMVVKTYVSWCGRACLTMRQYNNDTCTIEESFSNSRFFGSSGGMVMMRQLNTTRHDMDVMMGQKK